MSNKPLVSIIIPTYNRANMIEKAIKSAIDQTYPNKEIFVVDDGSTDNTKAILKRYPEVFYIHQKNAGQAAARNKGLSHAKGMYIASLDSDDEWEADFILKSVDFLEKNNLDFVFANWNQQTVNGQLKDFFLTDSKLKTYLHKAVDSWVLLNYSELREMYLNACLSPSSSMVIRRSSMVTGWNEKMIIADDWCMILDMLFAKECRAAFTTERLWLKHVNCNNIYNGRDRIEVNKLLWVQDLGAFITRFNKYFTKTERTSIKKNYLERILIAAHDSLFALNLKESLQLMKRALKINPVYSIKIFPRVFVRTAVRFKRLKRGVKKESASINNEDAVQLNSVI